MTDASDTAVHERLLALLRTHGDELERFVLGVTRDRDLARDVMQAACSKALQLGHTARPETFKGWLFRVALHEALAARRRGKAGDRARLRLAHLAPAADHPHAEDRLVRDETAEAVRTALERLPEPQRRVVLARFYDEKTFAEIARESKLPLGTVLTRMRLAVEKLRQALRDVDARPRPEAEPESDP